MAEQYEKYIRDQLSQNGTTHNAKGMITNQDYDMKWQIEEECETNLI